MVGLLPLKLQQTERSLISTVSISTNTSRASSPIPPPIKPRPRPISDLLTSPYTHEEWRVVMDEVKALYMNRQYKRCSARCIQILESITDPYRVHPLNSLYLCFYCATCYEITALSLHNNAPQKLYLLQTSLSYYEKADSYITFAELPDPLPGSRLSSTSSTRSSVDSIFSSAPSSTSSTHTFSPRLSSSSFYEEHEKTPTRNRTPSESSGSSTRFIATTLDEITPAPLRIKKKVSFSSHLPTLISAENSDENLVDELSISPLLPPSTPPRSCISSTYQTPSPKRIARGDSIKSYSRNLASLSSQITYHVAHVNKLIAEIYDIKKARRSNAPSFAPALFNSMGDININNSKARKKNEIKERVARLKEGGWQMKRWDGGRYETLRDKVECEMNGWS